MAGRPEWWLTILAKIWPITWISAKATTWPVLGPLVAKMTLPLFTGSNLNISYIPVNEKLSPAKTSLLPVQVVETLIQRSSYHAIIKRCTCRDARQCKEHPVELGCLFLGESAKNIDSRIARHVTKQEAIEHLHKTIQAGLTPMVGRVKIDNYIWGVRDNKKLVTICFCCYCCCTILTSLKYFPKDAADSLVALKGVRIAIDLNRCDSCGVCVETCPAEALKIKDLNIVRDEQRCKTCGRCISICPKDAVSARVENIAEVIDALTERIKPMADLG